MSVSLLAIVALVAGIFFNRSRQPSPTPGIEADHGVKSAIELEALRRAGI